VPDDGGKNKHPNLPGGFAMANKIEVNYEDLEALSKRFSQNYDRWHQFVQLLKTRVNHVYATWEGKGADLFEHEMENLVLPAVQRLGNALHAGQDTCKKIGQEFQDCEEEAGNLFKADGDGGAGGAAGGIDSQFRFFRPGLRFNEGVFPKLGGGGEDPLVKLGGTGDKFTKFDIPWGGEMDRETVCPLAVVVLRDHR
jgi:WXG100 family type VII secretion target